MQNIVPTQHQSVHVFSITSSWFWMCSIPVRRVFSSNWLRLRFCDRGEYLCASDPWTRSRFIYGLLFSKSLATWACKFKLFLILDLYQDGFMIEAVMVKYCVSTDQCIRWPTREVLVGSVGVGGDNPIRIQSMTTTSTRDVEATVEQIILLSDAGCEIARVTVQGKK